MNTSSKALDGGSIFGFIADLFHRHHVQGLLVGGYALVANKVQRTTFDIDFMMTAEDCAKLEAELLTAGYTVFSRVEAFIQFKANQAGLRDLDFLLTDAHTLERLITEGLKVQIAGEQFIAPSPRHLIAMKLHSIGGNRKREMKDLPDVVQLMIANDIDPKTEDIRQLFERHNTMDLYQRVVDAVGNRQ